MDNGRERKTTKLFTCVVVVLTFQMPRLKRKADPRTFTSINLQPWLAAKVQAIAAKTKAAVSRLEEYNGTLK
jgi:hypothetical protein